MQLKPNQVAFNSNQNKCEHFENTEFAFSKVLTFIIAVKARPASETRIHDLPNQTNHPSHDQIRNPTRPLPGKPRTSGHPPFRKEFFRRAPPVTSFQERDARITRKIPGAAPPRNPPPLVTPLRGRRYVFEKNPRGRAGFSAGRLRNPPENRERTAGDFASMKIWLLGQEHYCFLAIPTVSRDRITSRDVGGRREKQTFAFYVGPIKYQTKF